MRRKLAAVFAAVSVAAGGGLVAAAAPASAATPVCKEWSDSNSFGARCYNYTQKYYHAVARCKNGSIVKGTTRSMNSGTWSYAYCTSVNSSLQYGYEEVWG